MYKLYNYENEPKILKKAIVKHGIQTPPLDIQMNFNYQLPRECFRVIDFYNIKENMYIISSYGRIFSMHTGRELQPSINNEYKRLELMTIHGYKLNFLIHRLVAMAFIPKTEEDIRLNRDIVNHKNCVKVCNYVWNLEWTTSHENTLHALDNGMMDLKVSIKKDDKNKKEKSLGENNGQAKLTDEIVHVICKSLEDGCNYGQCCINAKIENNSKNRNNICNIKAGRRWQHISCNYNIENTKKLIDYSEYVRPVCELLITGMKVKDIISKLKLPGNYDQARMFISTIKNKKTYVEISDEYFGNAIEYNRSGII